MRFSAVIAASLFACSANPTFTFPLHEIPSGRGGRNTMRNSGYSTVWHARKSESRAARKRAKIAKRRNQKR